MIFGESVKNEKYNKRQKQEKWLKIKQKRKKEIL